MQQTDEGDGHAEILRLHGQKLALWILVPALLLAMILLHVPTRHTPLSNSNPNPNHNRLTHILIT